MQVCFLTHSPNCIHDQTNSFDVVEGVDPYSLKGTNTGFYFGSCFQETNCILNEPTKTPGRPQALVTRVSRHFQFRGPIVQTDTACGSSFTALAEAYSAIAHGLCDQAICAGSNTIFRPRVSLQFRDLKMITRDGKCKCLDQEVSNFLLRIPDSH
jgi:acyl transferase domain-containing protein